MNESFVQIEVIKEEDEMEFILQVKDLTKKIKNKTIIDELSFDVPRGEVFGFLGPNGAGKTTTIRMMVGLMGVTNGEILINGISVQKNFEKAMEHVGAIVENPELYSYLSGYKNLIHFARMTPGVSRERIDEVVKLVGLQNRIHDKVKTYSLGMRQRLGVAQALLNNPSLLILDEPTNGLDPKGIRELRDYLRELTQKEGITVIVSSHLLSEMELMCDRVAIIQNGKLVNVQKLRDEEKVNSDENLREFFFKVNDPTKAQEVIDEIMVSRLEQTGIVIKTDYNQVPMVNKALVEQDIQVFGIQEVTKTLEDRFLELTRSEGIV